MAEADLSPTTFTSRSASVPDCDISTEDSSENESENTYTEASSDNSSSDPETESNAKTEVRRSSTMPKDKAKADLNWIKLSSRRTDQITENNLQERVVNGPLKNEKSRQILPKSRNLAQPNNGSQSLRFCVCRSHICFSIKSLNFSVSVSDFKVPVSGVSASLGFTIRHPYKKWQPGCFQLFS